MRARSPWLVPALIVALTFLALARPVARADTSPPGFDVVEEVRYASLPGGLVAERHVLVDRSVISDVSAAATALTGLEPSDATVTAQYVLNPWQWASTAIPVPVWYNPGTSGKAPSAEPAIQAAIGQWSSVTSAFRFTYAGTTNAGISACIGEGTADGVNTIGFVQGIPAGILGQTCTLSGPDGHMIEFDMQINPDIDWGVANPIGATQYDLASTVLHELGHAAGLGHTADSGAVMYRSIGKGQMKRTLQPDDIAGLSAQYPGGIAPAPPPTVTPMPIFHHGFELFTAAVAHD